MELALEAFCGLRIPSYEERTRTAQEAQQNLQFKNMFFGLKFALVWVQGYRVYVTVQGLSLGFRI